ncbi:MAG: LSM domain-containing protein [Candidatus Caldarchaeales archaeon]|nr:LSM domain-containing protein [Candidatus Caldarchaeales archaeon]
MSTQQPVRPLSVIKSNFAKTVKVRLKNDIVYVGTLVEADNYMNLVINRGVEYFNEVKRASYPYILVRGNNILYIQLDYSE